MIFCGPREADEVFEKRFCCNAFVAYNCLNLYSWLIHPSRLQINETSSNCYKEPNPFITKNIVVHFKFDSVVPWSRGPSL